MFVVFMYLSIQGFNFIVLICYGFIHLWFKHAVLGRAYITELSGLSRRVTFNLVFFVRVKRM